MLVAFTTTYVSVSINDVNSNPPHACDNVCQLLAAARWFSPDSPVSSINKTDRHDITEILLKVALNATTPNPISNIYKNFYNLVFIYQVVKDVLSYSRFISYCKKLFAHFFLL
jgi:hypothetical protein